MNTVKALNLFIAVLLLLLLSVLDISAYTLKHLANKLLIIFPLVLQACWTSRTCCIVMKPFILDGQLLVFLSDLAVLLV